MRQPTPLKDISPLVAHGPHSTSFQAKDGLIITVPWWPKGGVDSYDDVPTFKAWLRDTGWKLRRTYKGESRQRAFTATGTGVYAGLSAMCIWRPKVFTDNPKCDVYIDTSISMFYDQINLGQFGIKWVDFLRLDPADADCEVLAAQAMMRVHAHMAKFGGFMSHRYRSRV